MPLAVHIVADRDSRTGSGACGIIIADLDTAEILQERVLQLESPACSRAAEYESLLKALQIVIPMNPDEVEFRTATSWLIDQLTGAELASDPLLDELQSALLRLDLWRITRAEGATHLRAGQLARG
jgi:ribonuclease HI